MDWGLIFWISFAYWFGIALGFLAGTDIERKRHR